MDKSLGKEIIIIVKIARKKKKSRCAIVAFSFEKWLFNTFKKAVPVWDLAMWWGTTCTKFWLHPPSPLTHKRHSPGQVDKKMTSYFMVVS